MRQTNRSWKACACTWRPITRRTYPGDRLACRKPVVAQISHFVALRSACIQPKVIKVPFVSSYRGVGGNIYRSNRRWQTPSMYGHDAHPSLDSSSTPSSWPDTSIPLVAVAQWKKLTISRRCSGYCSFRTQRFPKWTGSAHNLQTTCIVNKQGHAQILGFNAVVSSWHNLELTFCKSAECIREITQLPADCNWAFGTAYWLRQNHVLSGFMCIFPSRCRLPSKL